MSGPLILGLETSCDETSAAVLQAPDTLQGHVIYSQDEHALYGGVVPEIAARAHVQRIDEVVDQALAEAGCALGDLDAVAVGLTGQLSRRIEEPEVQFVAFAAGGGHFAEVDASGLQLRQTRDGRTIPLDRDFARALDFAQDIKPLEDGRVVVTRWSGHVHVVSPDGQVASVRLPSLGDGGLYYTAVARGNRVCATHCGGVRVVCSDLD